MKIQVVGSGSMWTSYNSASYLIDDNIIVDIPNGMCKYLYRLGKKVQNINHVLITHFHGDHYFDIPFYYLLKSKSNNTEVNVYCSKEGKRKCEKLLKLAFPNPYQEVLDTIKVKYNYKENFKVNDYEVKKYLVDHGAMKPAFGYVFKFNNNKIGFTGDTSYCKAVNDMAKECQYLFCDCMYIKGTNKHMGINDIKELTKKYPNCKFIVSHLDDETRNRLNEEKIKNVIIPNDGDIINIE